MDNPYDIQGYLISFAESILEHKQDDNLGCILDFIQGLEHNSDWLEYCSYYEDQIKTRDQVRLKGSRDSLGRLTSSVFLNQMESRGRFYYEPHISLYEQDKSDISFFIELEDLLTLKIRDELIQNGDVATFLHDKRILGLSRNYSDRLQNIMGYYFSKIGTKDIRSQKVLSIYDFVFEDFILLKK